jgi:hypothetical protein
MTLDEWIGLSPAERNEHRRSWERDSGEWLDLLRAAHARFEAEYKSQPLINYIGYSKWYGAAYEPSILVTTALYPPQLIEELPDRFCTFRVAQEAILGVRDEYLRYWMLLFRELLGWTEAQTLDWARSYDSDLNGAHNQLFYHEDPYYYALPEVVRQSVPPEQTQGWPLIDLTGDVCKAIRSHGSEPIWLSPYDWDAARSRVNVVLDKVGGRLPHA